MTLVTTQKLRTLTKQVEYCLDRFPETRNSDISLQARLCENFMPPLERPIYNYRDMVGVMQHLPNLDHIARARRKVIQNHQYKKYLPTSKEIAAARKLNMEIWKQYAATSTVDDRHVNPTSSIPTTFTQRDIYGRDV